MKNLISSKAIYMVTATIIFGMIMSSVALITPAAADRLTENPDIHKPRDWAGWHENGSIDAYNNRRTNKVMNFRCTNRCRIEEEHCYVVYWKFRCEVGKITAKAAAWCTAYKGIVQRDCRLLELQCRTQECSRYK